MDAAQWVRSQQQQHRLFQTPPACEQEELQVADDVSRDACDVASVLASIQQQPGAVNALHRHEALPAQLNAVGRGLNSTLLPILQSPLPSGESDIAFPNCHGVRGIGGPMVTLAPIQNQQSLVVESFAKMPPVYPSPLQMQPVPKRAVAKQERVNEETKQKPEPEFKTSFQFVVNADMKERRETVRKHVMKEYRRRERWEQDRKNGKTPSEALSLKQPSSKRRRKNAGSPPQSASLKVAPTTNITCLTSPLTLSSDSRSVSLASSSRCMSVGATSPTTIGSSVPDIFDEAIEELQRNDILPHKTDPWAAVAASSVDPFSRFNADCGPATQALLHHCRYSFEKRVVQDADGCRRLGDAEFNG